MLKITARNQYGDSLQVTQCSQFRATAAGLNPPAGTVYTADLATKNGSLYNSSKVNNRNIILNIWPTGAHVEAARLALYKVFKISKWIRLEIETDARKTYIDGYIEDMPGDLFENPQQLQISIICPDPFLLAKTPTAAAVDTAGAAETIENAGDFETGAVFEITATGAASDITITNETTGQTFAVDIDLETGDKLTLNTKQGDFSLTYTASGADPVNVLNLMQDGSKWIELQPGNNAVSFNATSGGANLAMAITFSALYGGI